MLLKRTLYQLFPWGIKGLLAFGLLFSPFFAHAQLLVDFSLNTSTNQNADTICIPDTRNFINTSSYNGVPITAANQGDFSISWDLNNKNIGIAELNPTVTYDETGLFEVTLTITHIATGETATETKSNYVHAFSKPKADFVAEDFIACAPISINFTDLSSSVNGAIESHSWAISGAGLKTEKNPVFNFTISGQYNLTYRVTDEVGCRKDTIAPAVVTVIDKPKPNIVVEPDFACDPPLDVDLSTDQQGPFSFTWTVEGGAGIVGDSVSTTINTSGIFDVSLVVDGPRNCAVDTTLNDKIVIDRPIVDFTFPTPVCQNRSVRFTNATVGGGNSFEWDFGDGTTRSTGSGNVNHTYSAPGTYFVTLKVITPGNLCDTELTKEVQVEGIRARIQADQTRFCAAPATVNFDASSSDFPPGSTFEWNLELPASQTSNPLFGQTVAQTYNEVGSFDVQLIVRSPRGCVSSVFLKDYIEIEQIEPTFDVPITAGCAPLEITVEDQTDFLGFTLSDRTWSFSDGRASVTDPSVGDIEHTWNDTGTYSIFHSISFAEGCSFDTVINFNVGSKPSADFLFSPEISCAYDTTFFNDSSVVIIDGQEFDDLIDEWRWTFFQDNKVIEISSGEEVFLQHQDSGTIGLDTAYTAQLVVGWNMCYDTITKEDIYHKFGPIVQQETARYDCTIGKVVISARGTRADETFWQDILSGSIYSNKLQDTIELPAGQYFLTTVSNNFTTGCTYRDSLKAITVPEKIPALELVTDRYQCFNDPLIIQCATNNPDEPNACRFLFNVNDARDVDLVSTFVTHESGDSLEVNTIINIGAQRRFSFSIDKPGTYYIKTEVLTPIDSCLLTLLDTVYYFEPKVEVSNLNGILGGCAPLDLSLDATEFFEDGLQSTSYEWNIKDSDGNLIYLSNNKTPSDFQITEDGDYEISLLVETTHDSGLVCPAIVSNLPELDISVSDPKPDFELPKTRFCEGESIAVNNTTETDLNLSYRWILEDGSESTDSMPTFIASAFDTLNITLEVSDGGNCFAQKTLEDAIIIDPSPDAGFVAETPQVECPPLNSFIYPQINPAFAEYSFTWYVDGELRSNLDTAFVSKSTPGSFGASLVVSTPAGCTDSIRVEDVFTISGPSAELEVDKDTICAGDVVNLKLSNVTNVSEIQYVFGDGTQFLGDDTDTDINHQYNTKTGETNISVFLDPQGCNVFLSDIIFINNLLADFESSADSLCGEGEITFTDVSIGQDYASEFTIDPIGVSLSNQSTFTRNFEEGNYLVTLRISEETSGCVNEISKSITVFPEAQASIDPDSVLCFGESMLIEAGGGETYTWQDPGDGSLDPLQGNRVTANPSSTTTYTVEVTDVNKCSAEASITVFRDKTNLDFSIDPSTACESLQLSVTDNSVGDNYFWDFGDGTTSNQASPSKLYQGAGTYNGEVSLWDLSPRCTQTESFTITINPNPSYTKSGDAELCLGEGKQVSINTAINKIEWTTDPSTIPAPTEKSFFANPTEDVVYRFVLTDETTGCISEDDIVFLVDNPQASYDIDILDSCGISKIDVQNPSAAMNQNFILGNGDPDVFPLGSYEYVGVGQYRLQYVVYDRFERCADTASSIINVHPTPRAQVSNDVAMCREENAVLSATGGISYKWTPDTGILGADNSDQVVVSPNESTVYQVKVGNQFSCFDSATIGVTIHPDFTFDSIPDQSIRIGEFIDLSLNPSSSSVSIKWSPDEWLNCTDCDFQSIQPLSNVCYRIELVDDQNCYPKVINPCIDVEEMYTVDVPKAFTPNNDMVNDVIFVRGFGIKELVDFTIFNRFGEEVFKTNNINVGWDGKYKGAIQNDETYVYQARVLFWNGEVGEKSGYISLLK